MQRPPHSSPTIAVVLACLLAACAAFLFFLLGPARQPDPTATPAEAPKTYADMARAGEVDALMALSDNDPGGWKDAQAYKWLAAASDFGHKAAEAKMADLLEISSLRYDDGNLVTGHMHYELAMAYLTGGEGLPLDLAKARKNLESSLDAIEGVELDLEADRKKLSGDALRVYDEMVPARLRAPKGP